MAALCALAASAANAGDPAGAFSAKWLRRDRVVVGTAGDLPEGFFVYSLGKAVTEGRKTYIVGLPGIRRSPLRLFDPAVVVGTEVDYEVAHIDISDDGRWLLYSCTAAPADEPDQPISGKGRRLVLCRLDGAARLVVPTRRDGPEALVLSGFYRRSPYGSEIFYSSRNATIRAVRVDWTVRPPRIGDDRILCDGIAWDGDDAMAVSGNHLHGRLGELSRYVTIPDGGKGTAGPDHLWRFTGNSRFGCAVTMSHDGRLAISNPTQLARVDRYPVPGRCFPIWHRGFVVLPFKEAHEPPMDIADYYFTQAVSANWVMHAMRPGNHDYSEWHATNRNEYVIGREISRKPTAYGCWMIHWPTNTWTRVTDRDTLALGPAAFLAGAAASRPATTRQAGPGAGSRPARLLVRATLVQAGPLPTPRSISPYKQALVYNVYRVEEVLRGRLEGRTVLVGHWAVRDGKTAPGARRREGKAYELAIEPLDLHPRLKEIPALDRTGEPDLPVYYDLGDAAPVRADSSSSSRPGGKPRIGPLAGGGVSRRSWGSGGQGRPRRACRDWRPPPRRPGAR